MAQKLFPLGLKLERIIVLPDDEDAIAQCVSAYSKEFDIVVTSGGVGPTHDDITYQCKVAHFSFVVKSYILKYYPTIGLFDQ